MKENSFYNLLEKKIKENKSKLIFQKRDGWSWKQITWLDLQSEVKGIACFLLDLGFRENDKVIFYSANTIESLFFKLALYLLGGITIPVKSKENIKDIIESSDGNYFLFSDTPDVIGMFENDSALQEKLTRAFIVTDDKLDIEGKYINYTNVVKFGFLKTKKLKDTLEEHSRTVSDESTATLFYKFNGSKTPEMIKFSQQKILNLLKVIQKKLKFVTEETQTFSYLPDNNSFSQFANILNIQIGSRGAIASSKEDFYQDILEVMPNILYLGRKQLDEIVKEFRGKDEKIGESFGGRLKYIFTDSMPGDDIKTDLVKDGITVIELNQLALVDNL